MIMLLLFVIGAAGVGGYLYIKMQGCLLYTSGEALTDEKFRKMITETEKYLGYPYVWGGSSPSTSFDCSGFVSWVINLSYDCGSWF